MLRANLSLQLSLIAGYLLLAFASKAVLGGDSVGISYWPAAGVANAMVSIYGYRLMPAAALAGFFSAFPFYQWNGLPAGESIFIGFAIALQAALVKFLVDRLGGFWRTTDNPLRLFCLLLRIGPVGCWPSALTFFCISGFTDITQSLSWWLGDCMGSLVTFPILSLIFSIPNDRRADSYRLPLAFLAALGVLPIISSLAWKALLGDSSHVFLSPESLPKLALLLTSNQFIFVFLGVGLILYVASISLSRDRYLNLSVQSSSAASSVLHELSQPLLRLKINLERIQSFLFSSRGSDYLPSLQEYVDDSIDELSTINRLSRSIRDLTLSGIRDSASADLGQAILLAIDQVQPQLDEMDQDLRLDLPSARLEVSAGRIQLQAALRNLISNASFAAGDQGVIRLAVRTSALSCWVDLQDSGNGFGNLDSPIGIAPVPSTHGGLGIGLTIVRRVVDDAGGRLMIRSSTQLGGARILVELPLASSTPGKS